MKNRWITTTYILAALILLAHCGSDTEKAPVAEKPITYSIVVSTNSFTGTLVLQNNGGDDLTINSTDPDFNQGGAFAFKKQLEDQKKYKVTVKSDPDATFCTVNDGEGTVDGQDVVSIRVICVS